MLYPGSRFRMADEMLETYIRQLIEGHQVPQVNVAWQGGEPTLMGVDFFNRSIEYVEKYRKPGMSIEYTIQTNGTLIDDAWAAFFKTHNFLAVSYTHLDVYKRQHHKRAIGSRRRRVGWHPL